LPDNSLPPPAPADVPTQLMFQFVDEFVQFLSQ